MNLNNNLMFDRILTIISSNDNALKVLGEVMGNLEDGGSVSINTKAILIIIINVNNMY